MTRLCGAVIASFVFLLASAGCARRFQAPDLGNLYNRTAQYHGVERNPIVVIPGILGSSLADFSTGQTVWGAFRSNYARPGNPKDAQLIAHPMEKGVPISDLLDDVVSTGVVDRLRFRLLGLPVELNAYVYILEALGAGGYRDEDLGTLTKIDYGQEHFTCFQFHYDWRRDMVVSARSLDRFLHAKAEYVQSEWEERFGVRDKPVKFDIVAHSMGGLVLRYYLRYGTAELPADGSLPKVTWAGAEYVERAILVGTPNAGSYKALERLVNGRRFAPFTPRYQPALLGTFPSAYQLLPRPRHELVTTSKDGAAANLYDVGFWKDARWGLADPKQDRVLKMLLPEEGAEARRDIALDHLEKSLARAAQFHAALDQPATRPAGLELHLITGDAMATPSKAVVDSATGALAVVERDAGDRTVLRSSALMDERRGGAWSPMLTSPVDWTNVTFFFQDHLGMTQDPEFADNVLYLLLEDPRKP